MKTMKIKMLCVLLCMAIICGFVGVSAQSDNDVRLEVVFDRDLYVPGDIATVTLNLTGLEDEVAAGKMLGFFEAHLDFNPDEMTFIPTDSDEEFCSQWCGDIVGDTDTKLFQVTEKYNDTIVIAFDKQTAVEFTCDSDGKLPIAEIRFMVDEVADGGLSVGFSDDDNYPSFVAVAKVDNVPVYKYNCTNGDAIEADVDDFLTADTTAYIDEEGNITDTIEAGSAIEDAFLVAKLYNVDTGLLAAPVRIARFEGRATIEEGRIFSRIPTDGTYKIEYYLWDCGDNGTMSMKPLAQKITATVEALQ